MDLSIIIVSYKVKDLLNTCLSSIFKQNFPFSYEVIVVDNNSGDQTDTMVKNDFPTAIILPQQQNLGFAKANNLGIKTAQGETIMLLNPDTELLDDSLTEALARIKNDSAIGILGCKILNPDGSIQPSIRKFPKFFDHFLMMLKLHHLFPLTSYLCFDFDYEKEAVVDQVMGAAFLFKKTLTNKIGLLDEGYHVWFEEVDYCLKAKQAGLKTIYFPACRLRHYGGQSFKQLSGLSRQWRYSSSRLRFLRKNSNPASYLAILFLTPLSLLLSAINFTKWKTNFSTKYLN